MPGNGLTEVIDSSLSPTCPVGWSIESTTILRILLLGSPIPRRDNPFPLYCTYD
jgi:hypothetical protein